jgi:hypothetical protein
MKPEPTQHADTEPAVDPREIEAVLDEEAPGEAAPETTTETQRIVEWDISPDSTGEAAEKSPPDDEATIAEQLVSSGLSEADRDQRLAAVDPDFEP